MPGITNKKTTSFNIRYILGLTLVSALGGLLFGYDWVVIGGAKPFYERYFEITAIPHLQGWAMGSALIGCLLGAVSSGYLSDRFGRKMPLLTAALLFTVSALGTGASGTYFVFILFRLLGGIGIGIASAVAPMYIAEISPAHLRGRLVAVNQLTIVIGILAAQIINYLIAEPIPIGATNDMIVHSWNGQWGWRWMFWAETVPAAAFLALVLFIPESPRFLAKSGRQASAVNILTKIGGKQYASAVKHEITETLSSASSNIDWDALRSKKVRPVLIIGIVLAIFQQWCGINVIFNYAEEVFISAGYSVSEMLLNIIITGSVNLIFTIIAMRMVDNLGRRKMMLIGSAGLTVLYIILGSSYYFGLQGTSILIVVVTAIAVYAFTLAPVTWVVLSEIFPNRIRGTAMAIAVTALWSASFILTYTFPILNNLLNTYGTFWLYALISLAGFLFIYKMLPETKGLSLEEIEQLFKK